LNPAFTSTQVIAAMNHLSAAHLIISAEINLPFKPPRSSIPLLTEMISNLHGSRLESEILPSLSNLVLVDNSAGRVDIPSLRSALHYEDVLEDGGTGRPLPNQGLQSSEVCGMQFTSGTTGMPKAAELTHVGLLNNGLQIGDRMLLTPNDVICVPPPLFHCFGCILGYMATATHGSAIVFPSEAFDPLLSLRAVQDYECTGLYGVPTMFLAELELLSDGKVPRTGLNKLRTGIAAGSSVPSALMSRLHAELNLTELTICYGMTETSPVSFMTTTDDPLEKRLDSVGRLLPHVQAKIVDPEDRSKILKVGERGELAVSGYLVMRGYWGDKEKTDEVLQPDENGRLWMFTGDEGSFDSEGYVKITGRIKDLIIRGGENIHPLEVENCLLGHPSVNGVSVVGIKDERYGEVVAAFVVKRHGHEATGASIRSFVKQRLSSHLVPKYVFFVDDFPKTASGKIQKFKLKDSGEEMVKEGKGLD